MAKRRAATRATRAPRISYRESSSSEDISSQHSSPPPRQEKRRNTRSSRKATQDAEHSHQGRRAQQDGSDGVATSQRQKASLATVDPTPYPSDHIFLQWTSLPYEILFAIFQHASSPLLDSSLTDPKPAVGWLLRTARVCRAFCEPALAALYEWPPLCDLIGPHYLLRLLQQDPSTWVMPYATKIKGLELDPNRTLGLSVTPFGRIDFCDLVSKAPNLAHILLLDETDRPPYRGGRPGTGWKYPTKLFDILSEKRVQLRSWHWNTQMIKRSERRKPWLLPEFAEFTRGIHESHAFRGLHELSISHLGIFDRKPKKGGPIEQVAGEYFASVIAPLKQLKRLSLVSCTALEPDEMSSILEALPNNLEALTITNSQSLWAKPFSSFLKTHGSKLRELTLDYNQALDLSFLMVLKESCPRLRSLHMDLTFYNTVASYGEKDPLFEKLLSAGDKPTWPASLESIEMYNLRQWEADAAEDFFLSLIDAGSELPYLRVLILKVILNIGWRARAGFRETWISRLRKTFLARPAPPDNSLMSKRAYVEAQSQPIGNTEADKVSEDDENEDTAPRSTRRSQRIKAHQLEEENQTQVSRSPSSDRSVERIERNAWKEPTKNKLQGLCDVVDVIIDNGRPGEYHYNEADFLDEGPAIDDEEWNGDIPTSEPAYAW